MHTVAAAWQSVREDTAMYGGYLHPAIDFRARRTSDWMGAELVATEDIFRNGTNEFLLWEIPDSGSTSLTIDQAFQSYPDLVNVFKHMTIELKNSPRETEYAIVGWYVAHLKRYRRHHISLTCLPDRCMSAHNFDTDIAKGFDDALVTDGFPPLFSTSGMKTRISYFFLLKAVASVAPRLSEIFKEITRDEFITGVCLLGTRVVGDLTKQLYRPFALNTFVLASSVMHIMNHEVSADISPPGPTTKYRTNSVADTLMVLERKWQIIMMDRAAGITSISKGEKLTDNYGDRPNANLIFAWGFMIPKNKLDCIIDKPIEDVWRELQKNYPPFKQVEAFEIKVVFEYLKTVLLEKYEKNLEKCLGWTLYTDRSMNPLMMLVRFGAYFSQRRDFKEFESERENKLNSNYLELKANKLRYYIGGIINMTMGKTDNCMNYSCLKYSNDRQSMDFFDKNYVLPVLCQYCQSRLVKIGSEDVQDDAMIEYSKYIMAGDQFLDDGMTRNRSTTRAAQSWLLARFRKDQRALIKFCGGVC